MFIYQYEVRGHELHMAIVQLHLMELRYGEWAIRHFSEVMMSRRRIDALHNYVQRITTNEYYKDFLKSYKLWTEAEKKSA